MICPSCSHEATKVISFGLPMKLCTNQQCNTLWGFWSWIFVYCLAPIEGLFGDERGFKFQPYSGSYFIALWHWLTGKHDGDFS